MDQQRQPPPQRRQEDEDDSGSNEDDNGFSIMARRVDNEEDDDHGNDHGTTAATASILAALPPAAADAYNGRARNNQYFRRRDGTRRSGQDNHNPPNAPPPPAAEVAASSSSSSFSTSSTAAAVVGASPAPTSSRKRSLQPTSTTVDKTTTKHLRREGDGGTTTTVSGELDPQKNDDAAATTTKPTPKVLHVSSLDELLPFHTNLIRQPPAWLKSQMRIENDETMLHYSIRKNAKQAALALIKLDPHLIHTETAKGVTPLILASQKGNYECVQLLLEKGAKVDHVTVQGTTAVLQASHFGHLSVLKLLLEHIPSTQQQQSSSLAAAGAASMTGLSSSSSSNGPPTMINRRLIELSNFHHTTPLMRAAQEGHFEVCKYLVEAGALVNRKNRQCMTALMLASQRGHAKVCKFLIHVGHADMDATTESKSTPLLVACKRSHFDTIQVLITAGCELFQTDSRGRTAHDIALARIQNNANNGGSNLNQNNTRKVLTMLHPTYQIHCMRRAARQQRSSTIMCMWNLLQKERATLRNCAIHEWIPYLRGEETTAPQDGGGIYWKSSTMALLRTMTLPESLVQAICAYAPMPTLWDTRISMLTKRSLVNPNAALENALDMMDEVLEEGGLLQAFDQACIPPPQGHSGWVSTVLLSSCRAHLLSFVVVVTVCFLYWLLIRKISHNFGFLT